MAHDTSAKAPAKPRSGRLARSAASGASETLERDDWVAAARTMLIRDGAAAVKVERVATALNVTRGGFYWRFRDHADLMDALLKDWRVTNSRTMLAAIRGPGAPADRIRALMEVWVDEVGYDPAYDLAVRAWSTISKKVARVVRAVDEDRIEALHQLFLDAGNSDMEAFIRARVFYYHQVGYYAIGVKERVAKRREYLKLYYKVLTGFES